MNEVYVFDAYGTLFDVHAAIARHRAAAGPDADRFSDLWRTKQLEYSWTLTLAGRYTDFWTLTERALDYAFARFPSVDRALRQNLLDAYFKLDAFADALILSDGRVDEGFMDFLIPGTTCLLEALLALISRAVQS